MTTTPMSDLSIVKVTQADREAAAAFYGPRLARPNEVLVTAHMLAGKIDESPLIIAFARHRASEAERVREACAKVAEEAADDSSDANNEYDGGSGACGYRMACASIAAAIRSLQSQEPIV